MGLTWKGPMVLVFMGESYAEIKTCSGAAAVSARDTEESPITGRQAWPGRATQQACACSGPGLDQQTLQLGAVPVGQHIGLDLRWRQAQHPLQHARMHRMQVDGGGQIASFEQVL